MIISGVSINANSYSYYNMRTSGKRAATGAVEAASSATASDNAPLTDEELNLAKEYKAYLDFNTALQQLSRGEKIDEAYEEIALNKKEPHRFDNVIKAIGVQIFDAESLFTDLTTRPAYRLPRQNYHFDSAANSVSFGIGSKIPLGDYFLYVYDNLVSTFASGYQASPQDSGLKILMDYKETGDAGALDEIINAVTQGTANWGNNLTMNNSILSLVSKMGIDSSRDFVINSVTFEVKAGIVQTKGYTETKGEQSGISYLRALMERAYEQHLM